MERATGSAIQHVNTATLQEMPIWLPPLTVQQAILEVLNPLQTAASIHNRISATIQELRDLLVPVLMSPFTTPEAE
jgi:type I restriction enzyme M protein